MRYLELNFAFDVLHRNFDFRINNAFTAQSRNLQILNAQLFSRIGFVHDEIRVIEQQALDEIQERANNLTNPESDCIVGARQSLENALDYAGYTMNGAVGEVMFYVNEIERSYFYPYINVLQFESNVIQSTVLTELRRYNPVTDIDRSIQRLDDDYYVTVALYQFAIAQIASEMNLMDNHMNVVKSSFFPQLNSIRDYFTFQARLIKDSMLFCED